MTTATLGLAVDSGPVAKAVVDLDKLAPAAAKAETALEKVGPAATEAGAGASKLVDEINRVIDAADKASAELKIPGTAAGKSFIEAGKGATDMATKIDNAAVSATDFAAKIDAAGAAAKKINNTFDMSKLDRSLQMTIADLNVQSRAMANGTVAVNGLAHAHAGMSTQAMAAQHSLRSMAEQLALGIPLTQIMAGQMNHLSYAATGPGGIKGAFGEVFGAIRGLLTPMTLLIGGAAAAAGAAYLINSSWKATATQFDDTAKAAGTTIQQIQKLSSSAVGIDDKSFLDASEKFASNIYDAKNNMGSLGDLLRLNGQRATTFSETLAGVADLVQRANGYQQKLRVLQDAGLPATAQWVKYMSMGADGIRAATLAANESNPEMQKLVDKARDFDAAWERGWRKFKDDAYDAVTNVKGWLNGLRDSYKEFMLWQLENGLVTKNAFNKVMLRGGSSTKDVNYDEFYKATGAPNGPKVVDPAVVRKQISDQQALLSLYGATTTAAEARRQVELQFQAAATNGIYIDAKRAEVLKQLAYDQNLGLTALRASADAYKVEADTVGMSVGKVAEYTTVQNTLNEARRNGKVLTEDQIDSIKREAAALGEAAQRADEVRFEYDTFSGTMRDFGSNLRNGQTAWQAFGNAGANALGKIADRLMDMASRSLWNAAFPTGSGGGGIMGLFSSLFGGPTNIVGGAGSLPVPTFAANGATFSGPGINALSGQILTKPTMFAFANGAGIAGEAGDEAVMPLTRINGKLGVRAAGGTMGGQPVQITVAPVYTFNNADPAVEARLKRQIAETAQKTKDDTLKAVDKTYRSNAGYLK